MRSNGSMDAITIVLPPSRTPPGRPSLPILAAIVPVIGGVVLWLVTGSLFALAFAALGPLMLGTSFLDGLRTRRRDRRRAEREDDDAWRRAEDELVRAHDDERAMLRRRHPDAGECLTEAPLRGAGAVDADTPLVVGSGVARSILRVGGGDGDRARAFRERAAGLEDAPLTVPLGGGLCVRARAPIGAAVVRALVVQLCLRFSPSQLALGGDLLAALALDGLPHAARSHHRSAFHVTLGSGERGARAGAVLWLCPPGAEPPDGVTAVLDVVDPLAARLRTPDGMTELAVEGISAEQARALLSRGELPGDAEDLVPDSVMLSELDRPPAEGLSATIGRSAHGDLTLDLVADGPHAIVTGMTGTGKSELLVSWVTAICSAHGPDEVTFVLADFKGGTAFDPLRDLPQVTAVITDLDADGARRGVESLTAELRRREAALADAGVRDIREHSGMPRLVIVVDEFAALLGEHADLAAVFTDVAARGRALGMHLVLGTQRASGVIRDALAANCPLRLGLRVADGADSRLVIGSDAAAEIPGGPQSRGFALVRRPQDAEARPIRVALTSPRDLRAAASRWADRERARSPWLPALPRLLPLGEITADAAAGLVLGRADEPARQLQPVVVLPSGQGMAVIGGPGSGRTALVRLLAVQQPQAVVVPSDPEAAWDTTTALLGAAPEALVLADDIDALFSAFPLEHAQAFASHWERLVRTHPVVITLQRASGPLARIVDALPQRALLRLHGKVEHLAAGGEPDTFMAERPAGRATIGGREVQLCWIEPADAPPLVATIPVWAPRQRLAGVVSGFAAASALREALPAADVVGIADAPAALDAGSRVVVVADPEAWRANWTLLQRVRGEGEMLVVAELQNELRQLLGFRELPPYARTHAGRAWSLDRGAPPERVLLPGQLAASGPLLRRDRPYPA